jgi:ketosteroid isomerase-like protein
MSGGPACHAIGDWSHFSLTHHPGWLYTGISGATRATEPGTAFDFRELAVTAGADVAFAVAIMWCGPDSSSNPVDKHGFLFRLTVGLRKVDGDWRIAHEHHSVPATD